MENGSKVHSYASLRKELDHILGDDLREYWIVAVYAIGVGLLSLVIPVAMQYFVTTVSFVGLLQPIVIITLALILFLIFAGALQLLQFYTVEILSRRAYARLTAQLARRFPYIKPTATESRGALSNRFLEILNLQKTYNSLMIEVLGLGLQMGVGFLLLAFYHPVFLAFDLILIGILYGVGRAARAGAMEKALYDSKKKYLLFNWVQELGRSAPLFRSLNSHRFGLMKTDYHLQNYLEARKDYFRSLVIQNLGLTLIYAVGSALFLGMGGWLVLNQQLSLGQLIAGEIVIAGILSGIWKLGSKIEKIDDFLVALHKLDDLLSLPLINSGGDEMVEAKGGGTLRLRGVGHEYLPARMNPLSLEFPAGTRTLLHGRSGSGKSILTKLIAGDILPEKGFMDLQGVDTRQIHPEQYRNLVHCVRSVHFITGTIMDNMRVHNPNASVAEVRRLFEKVGLLERISRFPDGVDTPMHLVVDQLSTSERARMVMVRAWLAQPAVFVIDCVLEDLDPGDRARALAALTDKSHPWTVVVFSHAPDGVEHFDRVIALEELKASPSTTDPKNRGGV